MRAERKPVIDGGVGWRGASFRVRWGQRASFEGDGRPVGTATGVFPPRRTDDAARYAADTAALAGYGLTGDFPATPQRRGASCVGAESPVAVARNGVPFLAPFTSGGADAVAREVHDRCGGRTDALGRYYYRGGAPCLLSGASQKSHSPVVGYARDGFPLYGPRGVGGVRLRSRDLDRCHGHTHVVTLRERKRRVYHYHLTPDFPYTVGCLRGRPSPDWKRTPSRISTSPSLYPAFSEAVSDYVVRCVPGQPVRVSVVAPAGTRVAVDGARARSGAFTVPVALEVGQGFRLAIERGTGTTRHHVRCLPSDFPAWTATRFWSQQAEWYVVTPSRTLGDVVAPYSAIFDTEGVPVWWIRTSSAPLDAKLLPNGNLAWALGSFPAPGLYEERRLDGSLVRTLKTVGTHTDIHDLQLLPNGNVLLLSYPLRAGVDLSPHGLPKDATVIDAEVQEISPAGELVWSWKSQDHIGPEETGRWFTLNPPERLPDGRAAYDLVHINSVEPVRGGIIVSMRNTDAVYRIDRASGDVVWKLGGTRTPQSLKIRRDPHGATSFGGQHDARLLADGTLTVHDNGTARGRPPRAVRYRIDPDARTATVLENLAVAGSTSACCGGARRLPGGDWVVSWGALPVVAELDPSGHPVFRIQFAKDFFSYRAVPVAPGKLARTALRAGMTAMHPR